MLVWPVESHAVQQGGHAPLPVVPHGFVVNRGQWDGTVRFMARRGRVLLTVEPRSIVLQARTARTPGNSRREEMRVTLVPDDLEAVEPVALGMPLPGVSHYLLGGDPAAWRTDVPQYDTVEYALGRNASARVRWSVGSVPKLMLSVQRPADWDEISLRVDGVCEVLNGAGGGGSSGSERGGTLALPDGYGGMRVRVERLSSESFRIRFSRCGADTPSSIELPLEWSTYLGGDQGGEFVHDVARAPDGCPVILGETWSPDFPATPGAFQTSFVGASPSMGNVINDGFVTKLSPDGTSVQFSTFVGGLGAENPGALDIGASGVITLVGGTYAADYPTTTSSFDRVKDGGSDAFVSRLSADGSNLIVSTFVGGNQFDKANGIATLSDGRIVICGESASTTLPVTTQALQGVSGGAVDAFIAILDSTCSRLLYLTYVGGVGDDRAHGLALLPDGHVVASGRTAGSPMFPVTPGAFDTEMGPDAEGFAFALDPDAGELLYSTFLGPCSPRAIAAHPDGSVVIVGQTSKAAFPATPGAFDTTYNFGFDGFVTRLDATGSTQVWSTFLGGASADDVRDVEVDSAGRVTVVGSTSSGSFPYTPGSFPWPPASFGPPDFFVTRLEPDGSGLLYSTNLGGPEIETANNVALALDDTGAAFVAGGSTGQFPVTEDAFDTSEPVVFDATVSLLTMLPTGVSRFGTSSPGGHGSLAIDVTAMPALGAGSFALSCIGAPPSSETGLLVLGFGGLASPLVGKGIQLWVDPLPALVLLPARSDSYGYAVVPLPIPSDPRLVGLSTAWQFVWPSGFVDRPWSASNALEVVIQP